MQEATFLIRVHGQTRDALDALKTEEFKSYDDVITRILNRIALQDEMAKNLPRLTKK